MAPTPMQCSSPSVTPIVSDDLPHSSPSHAVTTTNATIAVPQIPVAAPSTSSQMLKDLQPSAVEHTTSKLQVCSCNFQTFNISKMNRHLSMSPSCSLQCTICRLTFRTSRRLNVHSCRRPTYWENVDISSCTSSQRPTCSIAAPSLHFDTLS